MQMQSQPLLSVLACESQAAVMAPASKRLAGISLAFVGGACLSSLISRYFWSSLRRFLLPANTASSFTGFLAGFSGSASSSSSCTDACTT